MTARQPTAKQRRMLLKAAAYLLGYPDEGMEGMLDEMRPDVERVSLPAAAHLATAMAALRALPADAREASYVATFDFSETRALYLTAHELGDSRRRGQALLDLRAMLRAAGFEAPPQELPDYLPLLLEFVGSAPSDVETVTLERRLAAVCAEIHGELAEGDPYRPVFAALCLLLPPAEQEGADAKAAGVAAKARRRPRFPLHERADTAELPYPLRYQE